MPSRDASRPFSTLWTLVSVGLFLAVELGIGTYLGPLVLGKYVSPMFHLQLQMMMHLTSFYVGGLLVGLLSPGVRIAEPAVGAFLSVVTVFLISFFMPGWFYGFAPGRLLVGGAIAFAIALAGAYSGEKLMGNVGTDEAAAELSTRGRLRSALWNDSTGLMTARERDRSR